MTNLARVQTVTFIDQFGEVFEVDAFPFDGGWVLGFERDMWVLEHDIHPLMLKPAGYFVTFTITMDGDIRNVEVQNLQGLSYFDE